MKVLNALAFLSIIAIISFLAREFYYQSKFDSTKLNITFTNLEEQWGKPDYEFILSTKKSNRVFKYNKSIFGQYIFLSDDKDSLIVRKAFDD